MKEKKTTKIARSGSDTIRYFLGAVGLLAISVGLFIFVVNGPAMFGAALIPAILSFALFCLSICAGITTCPGCGAPLDGLSTKSNDRVLCKSCHNYSEGRNGLLWMTDKDTIAATPIYTSPLPERFAFPPHCCVCGNAETHREKLKFTTQNASSVLTAPTIGVRSDTTISVEVPHCAKHKDGAILSATAKSPIIRFRSYPYLQEFCQLNGTSPE